MTKLLEVVELQRDTIDSGLKGVALKHASETLNDKWCSHYAIDITRALCVSFYTFSM